MVIPNDSNSDRYIPIDSPQAVAILRTLSQNNPSEYAQFIQEANQLIEETQSPVYIDKKTASLIEYDLVPENIRANSNFNNNNSAYAGAV